MESEESFSYRRGLTLGLTMAEIFLLILFILLLIFLALHGEYETIVEDVEARLVVVTKEKEVLEARNEILEEYPEEIAHLKRVIAEHKKDDSTSELIEEAQNLREVAEDLRAKNRELYEQLRAEKGVDPPCWYEVVDRNGRRHEKPYYLFDVAVHDDYMLIRINDNVPPPGRGDSKNGQPALTSYAEEYEMLPLADLRSVKEKSVSLEEFKAIAEPIKNMGKSELIRDYSCVFYTKIWDITSPDAKERWKIADEEVGNFFYPYRVKDDPWE